MFLKALGIIAIAVGALLAYVAFQPSDYKISRDIEINAPPETIFPYINNPRKNNEWMPWAETEPAMKMEYSGPEEGVGAVSKWASQGKMGIGSATVVQSVPNELVKTKLEYQKPFPMTQEAQISVTKSNGGSVVTWSVQGKNNFVGRLMCVFMNMDKMVGGQFEKGLSKLKVLVESKTV